MDFIYNATGAVLRFFDNIFGNYLLAILAIALIVKLILLPFGIKQQKNSIKQAKLSPKEAAIRKRYAGRNDQASQQKMQQEVMELYQSGGYSPLSGCLPVLIQMPIIILLYNTIMNPLKYVAGIASDVVNKVALYCHEFFGYDAASKMFNNGVFRGRDIELLQFFTTDKIAEINGALEASEQIALESIPKLDLFGSANALAANPSWTSWLLLIPLLNVLATIGSTLLTKKLTFQPLQQGQGQNKVMQIVMLLGMPIIIGIFAFQVPSAIGIYWLFNTLLSVIQTVILYFAMPLPKFTEEDYKQAERELKGKQQKEQRFKESQIRDDDLGDDLPDDVLNDMDGDGDDDMISYDDYLKGEKEKKGKK